MNAELSDTMKKHIDDIHFPFTCPFCSTILNLFENLIMHITQNCTILTHYKDNKYVTPTGKNNVNNQINAITNKKEVTTSTPMNVNDPYLLDIENTVTPVNDENALKNHVGKPSCLKYTPTIKEESKLTDSSIKRRVTFSDIIQDIEYDVENYDEGIYLIIRTRNKL